MTSAESIPTAEPASRQVRLRLGVRGWVRRVFLMAFLGATLWLAYDRLGGRLRLQWEIVQSQRACADFTDRPGRVLYDSDVSAVESHLREGGYEAVTFGQ